MFLSFYFPPSRASGVFRARAMANHLAQAGWDVTVLTAPREFFTRHLRGASDDALEHTVDPRVRVRRPRMSMSRWETDVRRFGLLRRAFPVLFDELSGRLERAIFGEKYLAWVPGVFAEAVAAHRRAPFDLVLATGNPFVSFAAAWALGRGLRVPYVARLPRRLDVQSVHRAGPLPRGRPDDEVGVSGAARRRRGRVRQRRPAALARRALPVRGREDDGRAERLGARAARPGPFTAADPDRPLRFGYLGTVTSYLPLDVLFAGWRLARAHPLMAVGELDIHGHLGFFPDDAVALRERLDRVAEDNVRYRGAFAKTDAAEVYAQTDALVFCVPGARYVTSGKVFEYLACGKPIVSAHRPEIAAAEVLEGYPLWFGGASWTPTRSPSPLSPRPRRPATSTRRPTGRRWLAPSDTPGTLPCGLGNTGCANWWSRPYDRGLPRAR